jgi:hypothetical protein
MTISSILGPIDQNAAIFLSIAAITICIITTTAIAKRRSRRDLDQQFQLAKITQENSHQLALKRETDARAVKEKQIEANVVIEREKIGQNLITSHASHTRTAEAYEE